MLRAKQNQGRKSVSISVLEVLISDSIRDRKHPYKVSFKMFLHDQFITRGTTSQRLGSISFSFFMSRLAIRSSDCHIWDLSPVPRVPRVKA